MTSSVKTCRTGDYEAALYASGLTALTPGLCTQFCSKNIPGPANSNSGQDWTRTNIPELDTQLDLVDTSLDAATGMAAAKKGDQIMAENMVTLPLDPLPDILIWSKKVVGSGTGQLDPRDVLEHQ